MVLFQQPFMSGGFPSMNRVVISPWQYDDEFTTDVGWTHESGGNDIDTVNGELDFNLLRGQARGSSIPTTDEDVINATVSDTAFVFDIYGVSVSSIDGSGEALFGLSTEDVNTNFRSSGDALMWGLRRTIDNTYDRVSDYHVDNASSTNTLTNQSWSTGTDYFLRIIRTSSTNVKFQIDDSSDYGSLLKDISRTINSTIQNLDHIRVAPRPDGAGAAAIGTVQRMRMEDGVSTPPE